MAKFNKGDFVKGTDRNRFAPSLTDEKLIKAEVLRTVGDGMIIKVLEHKQPKIIGNCYSVQQEFFDSYDHYIDGGFADKQINKNITLEVNEDKKVINIIDSLFIALPKSAQFGLASKHDEDEFNVEIGKALAYYRYTQSQE
jgi:hypothetical protein